MIAWMMSALCVGVSPVEVHLRPAAEVAGEVVRLADLADISSGPQGAALRRLDIADSPGEGGAAEVSRTLVWLRLQLAGYSPDEVRLVGAQRCTVRRVAPQPLAERLVDALRVEYARALDVPEDQLQVTLRSAVHAPDNDPLPTIHTSLGPEPRIGVQRANLELVSRQGARRVQPVTHLVQLRRTGPVVVRSVRPGELLRADDVRWEELLVSDPAPQLAPADVVDWVAIRPLRAGDRIKAADLRPATEVTMVRRQSRVECVAAKGALKVSMPGAIALDEGVYGQAVRIRNPSSGIEFTGIVDGPARVRIAIP